jgi:hypothetical protein
MPFLSVDPAGCRQIKQTPLRTRLDPPPTDLRTAGSDVELPQVLSLSN